MDTEQSVPRTWSLSDQTPVIEIFERSDAIINGHFVYAKGPKSGPVGPDNPRRHGPVYVAKDHIYISPKDMMELAEMIAEELADREIDLVVGIAPIANVLAHYVAFYLEEWTGSCKTIAAEKRGKLTYPMGDTTAFLADELVIRDSFQRLITPGTRILAVEDIVNSGGSFIELAQLIKSHGGKVYAGASLWNRGKDNTAEKFDVDLFFSLCSQEYPVWNVEDCKLCPEPADERYGHGKEFNKQSAQP